MKWCAVIATLIALNILLMVSHGVVGSAVRTLEETVRRDTRERLASLEAERERISGERIRLATTVAALSKELGELRKENAQARAEPDQAVQTGLEDGLPESSPAATSRERPDPLEIAILSRDEMAELDRDARKMAGLDLGLILSNDADTVLGDSGWNPQGRELGVQERQHLERLLSEYRYFYRDAHLERVERFVNPVVGDLRDAEAFIEYPQEDPPPEIEGVTITHAETCETPGHFRLYFFHPDEYPEMYHFNEVVGQQAVAKAVEIYRLVHG